MPAERQRLNQPHLRAALSSCLQPPEVDPRDVRRQTLAAWNSRAVRHFMGDRDRRCTGCGALHWVEERVCSSSQLNPKFSKCCGQGQIRLPPIGANIERMGVLHQLLTGHDPRSEMFRREIHKYNNAFAFTSIGMKRDRSTEGQHGMYSIRAQGRIGHNIGSLLPQGNEPHCFAQIYLLDTERAVETRLQHHMIRQQDTTIGLDRSIVQDLQLFYQQHNYYASAYRTAHRRFLENPDVSAILIRQVTRGPDSRCFNMPADSSEVAMVIVGDGERMDNGRDVMVHRHDRRHPEAVSELHPSFLPLHFPIIHPFGEQGWSMGIPVADGQYDALRGYDNEQHADEADEDGRVRAVTQLRWIRYHIHDKIAGEGTRMPRPLNLPVFSALFHAGKLYQEYIIDAWAQVEWGRLQFIEHNQTQLRADTYRGIGDAANAGLPSESIGAPVVLPSTFVCGPRIMQQLFQDALNIARHLGNPSFFVTMTCNPDWPEIKGALLPHQSATDRPDIVSRVFHAKLASLRNDLEKEATFGRVISRVHTIEFQKRGLPHAHIH